MGEVSVEVMIGDPIGMAVQGDIFRIRDRSLMLIEKGVFKFQGNARRFDCVVTRFAAGKKCVVFA